jgi:hypothetical protein
MVNSLPLAGYKSFVLPIPVIEVEAPRQWRGGTLSRIIKADNKLLILKS